MTLKGQNLRIFIGTGPVAEATSCTITLSTSTEDMSTKDDAGMASKPTVTEKSWQVAVDSLNVSDMGTLLAAIKAGTLFTLMWVETTVATPTVMVNTPADWERSGSAFLTDATFVFNDREYSTKNITFTGSGPISTDSRP